MSDVISNAVPKKKPARKWYNRFFTSEDTSHNVDYSIEIPTSAEVAQDVSDLYRRRNTTIDDTIHTPTFLPSDLVPRRTTQKTRTSSLWGLASRARSLLF